MGRIKYAYGCCRCEFAQAEGRYQTVVLIVNAWIFCGSACNRRIVRNSIHRAVGLRQSKRRDLDIKLLVTLIDHLVGAVHLPEWSSERAT